MTYAFVLPHLVMTCLHFVVPANSRFGNFDIYQPMTFRLETGSRFHDSEVHINGSHCGLAVIRTTASDIAISNTHVIIEELP